MRRYALLTAESRWRVHIVFQGIFVGFVAGGASICYRLLLEYAEGFSLRALTGSAQLSLPLILLLWAAVALFIGWLMEREPMARGSGIPQVEGELLGCVSMNWFRVLWAKFLGGGLAIALGLSLGREGPSVQIGAVVGKGLSRLQKKTKMEERLLLSSGASAGLAAAFNAPLSGVVFALEEVHKSFSPLILLSAMMASLGADFLSKTFFGLGPIFSFGVPSPLPLEFYGHFLVLGALCGVGGSLFCRVILELQTFYGKLPIPAFCRVVIPALVAVAVGAFLPEILGGGHALVERLGHGSHPVSFILLLFAGKLLFTALCFGSGAAGGIFLPMLALGAALGAFYGTVVVQVYCLDQALALNFLIVGMAGFFSAVVRAPITGIVLITEMTGSFTHLLSISAVAVTAYVVADLLRTRPIYDSLLLRMLRKCGTCEEAGNVLLEGTVSPDSFIDGKRVREARLPAGCLLVSIVRAGEEILPNGEIVIAAGDQIVALADGRRARRVRERLHNLLEVRRKTP